MHEMEGREISAVIEYTSDCMTQGRGNNCGQPNMQTETLD